MQLFGGQRDPACATNIGMVFGTLPCVLLLLFPFFLCVWGGGGTKFLTANADVDSAAIALVGLV